MSFASHLFLNALFTHYRCTRINTVECNFFCVHFQDKVGTRAGISVGPALAAAAGERVVPGRTAHRAARPPALQSTRTEDGAQGRSSHTPQTGSAHAPQTQAAHPERPGRPALPLPAHATHSGGGGADARAEAAAHQTEGRAGFPAQLHRLTARPTEQQRIDGFYRTEREHVVRCGHLFRG